jgi:DNA-directed RNA polymerase subunit RPC12/RpoP
MEIIFYCSKCSQEFAVDESAAGEQIQCPTCSEFLIIPQESTPRPQPAHQMAVAGEGTEGGAVEAPGDSAPAAQEEAGHHFAVPMHDGPSEMLIKKRVLEEAGPAKAKRIRTHCIKHFACVEVGRDKYDDVVTEFLQKVGEENIVSINSINYDVVDSIGRTLADYGVMIVYHG